MLYLVATPIGNLEDISYRALEVLKRVDLIAAEDTRHTGLLLKHFGIQARMVSYHEHNEARRAAELLELLKSGKSIAIVSDAGTPGISDPAYRLVQSAIQDQIPVVPIPGATAFVPALVASGLPTDRFVFEGFLPVKSGRRRKRLEELRTEERTIIFYESPYRLVRLLGELQEVLGDRKAVVAREVTKKFEEFVRGPLSEIRAHFQLHPPKGEMVVLVAGTKNAVEPRSEAE